MRTSLSFALLFLALAVGASRPANSDTPPTPAAPQTPALSVRVPVYPNTTCPIMGRPASTALFAETLHGRIYVCCPPCVAKIAKDPERAYQAAYPVTKQVGNSVCPVTDKPLGADALSVVLQGYEIRVCPTCVKQAQENSQIVLAKALEPKLVELHNRTCPITQQPVAANAFCVIGTELIHLASPKQVDDVKRDPAKALQTAREIVARQEAAVAAAPAPSQPAR